MVHFFSDDQYTHSRPPVPTNNPPNVPLPHQLLHHNTTAVNQVLGLPGMFSTFNKNQLKRLRIVAITSSSLSLLFGIIGVYCLINIDRRRKVFRHDLLFFLIVCGFIKALVLMIYPMVILIRDSVYFNPLFFNILGWFTAYTVEGSDLAIFFFAVHFALLIFRPSQKWRNKRTGNLEGGLYRVRALLWPLTGSVPLLLASLAFVNFTVINERELLEETTVILYNQRYKADHYARLGGYKPYSAWCYLPPYPLWYKLVLSWGPRYFLIIFILTLYATIYVFVLKESRKIKRELGEFKQKEDKGNWKKKSSVSSSRYLRIPADSVMKSLRAIKYIIFFWSHSSTKRGGGETRNSREHGITLSFFDDIESPQTEEREVNTRLHASKKTDNSNQKNGGNAGSSLPPTNSVSLRTKDTDSIIQADQSSQHEPNDLGCNSLGESYDVEERGCVEGDLYEALSTPPDVRVEATSSKSIPIGQRLALQEQGIDNRHHMSPTLSGPGMSTMQTIFRPLTNISGTSQRSHLYQASKKEEVNNVQADFQRQTYAEMKRRRLQIQKNVTLIFIYPFSYIAIWIFPLVVDVTQYNYEITHGPVVWLAYIATIVQPLNCFVDTLIFLFRERPWKYSWQEVQTKELMDTYMLKGELGENEIMELCSSEWGRRGWYYRGRFERKDCWRHQPWKWKRAVWFLYRLFKGLMRNHYSFEDHCNDEEYWDRYYFANSEPGCTVGQKHFSSQKERQFSFPSDSTTLSDSAHNNNQIKQIYANKRPSTLEEAKYRQVPLFWKIIHFFPMLEAIDLDELNRQLRLRSKDDEFVIPGLQAALQNKFEQPHEGKSQPSVFKPGYSLSDTVEGSPWLARRDHQSTEISNASNSNHNNGSTLPVTVNMDFSNVVAGNAASSASKKLSIAATNQDDSMDMLSFLKGHTIH
ncbi:GPR1 (YDL035C) [Zygosaccharomyces parabailii]|nr:GPR1 (YDL035C) [Zygosaccharomyces parabailii]